MDSIPITFQRHHLRRKRGMGPPLSLHMSTLGQASLYSFCLAVLFTELCGSMVNYAVMEKTDYTLSLVEEHTSAVFHSPVSLLQ